MNQPATHSISVSQRRLSISESSLYVGAVKALCSCVGVFNATKRLRFCIGNSKAGGLTSTAFGCE